MHLKRYALFGLFALLTACSFGTTVEDEPLEPNDDTALQEDTTDDTTQDSDVEEDVSYTGTVRTTGISIYQEGTHRLILDNRDFILLESDTVDLNGYVDERVEVTGDLRPTVEAGGQIMTVNSITLRPLDDSSDDEDDDVMVEDDSDTMTDDTDDDVMVDNDEDDDVMMEDTSADDTDEDDSMMEDDTTDDTVMDDNSDDSSPSTVGTDAQVEAMAKADFSSAAWTQRYCTEHIGFCLPIHRNWWYKSFGYTTSSLWYVEMGNEEIDAMGDGAIVVRLVEGDISTVGATDGTVQTQGNMVVGYRSWDDDRHFEIVADARLEAAVSYLTQNLVEYQEDEE